MTKFQRGNLANEYSLNDLYMLKEIYSQKMNEQIATYTLEKKWEKLDKIQKRIDGFRADLSAISHAICVKRNA